MLSTIDDFTFTRLNEWTKKYIFEREGYKWYTFYSITHLIYFLVKIRCVVIGLINKFVINLEAYSLKPVTCEKIIFLYKYLE